MRYNPSLDGVRALAVVLVMLFHAKVGWMQGGYLGVDIFFVLSGYLITSLLLSELRRYGTIDLVGFYARRLLRLAPALVALLAVYLVTSPWSFPDRPFSAVARDSIVALMYFSDYSQALFNYPDALVHTWSLSVEEHFYLIWPLLLWFWAVKAGKGRIRPGAFMVFALVLFMLATNWRLLLGSLHTSWDSLYNRFDTHASGLLLGCLLGTVLSARSSEGANESGWARGLLQFLPLLALLAIAYTLQWSAWGYPRGYITGIELAAAWLIGGLALWPRTWLALALSWSPIRYLGQISYGIYLWDYPIEYFLHARFPHMPHGQALAVTAVTSVLLASISYFTIERAARNLKGLTYAANRSQALKPADQ